MEPLKRPSDNQALIPSGAPQNKFPRPSDPKDAPASPTLLKALEAVLIAGRRGLLGPEAMAVAAGTPPLNLGASNGMAGQKNLNHIPLVEGQEKKKKPLNEKRTAVITIVRQAAGAQTTQVTPKDIWICGNSVILSSKKKASSQPFGLQLGISTSKAHVYWHGINSMKWEQLVPLLHEMYLHRSSPSVIIVHLGEDDLLPKNNISLMISMKNDLGILKRAFPAAIIVWSSLLPRCAWKKGQNPQLMEAAQKLVNKKMVDYCNQIGVHFLSHHLITSDKANLFLPDINALSNVGIDIFIEDLKKVLRFYRVLG